MVAAGDRRELSRQSRGAPRGVELARLALQLWQLGFTIGDGQGAGAVRELANRTESLDLAGIESDGLVQAAQADRLQIEIPLMARPAATAGWRMAIAVR